MKGLRHILYVLLIIFSVVACVTTDDSSTEEQDKDTPDWVLNPPPDDDDYMYFTASGQGENLAQAEEVAAGALIDSIMRYMGVRVESVTEADAKATLESYTASMSRVIKQTADARMVGFKIKDRWEQESATGVTLHLLAQYDREEIEKEKKRLEEIFIKKIEAVSVPEAEGDDFYEAGRFYESAIKYLVASAAALKSDLQDADISFERNMNKAMDAIESINIIKLNDNITGLVGEEIPESFGIKVVNGTNKDDEGIPSVVLSISYKEVTKTGKRVKTVNLKTDANGEVWFVHPIPQFVGPENVIVMLDMNAYLEKLENIPQDYSDMKDALEMQIITKKKVFEYIIESKAKEISTGILVVDLDSSGQMIAGSSETASGIMEKLSQAGFRVSSLSLDPTSIMGKTDAEILTLLTGSSVSVKRVIYGTAIIEDYSEDRGNHYFKVKGTIKVLDLDTGEILFTKALQKNAIGTNANTARSTAFKQLGELFGSKLVAELP